MKLTKNKRYQATVSLNPSQAWAPNVMVSSQLTGVGFTNVQSEGTGAKRKITGTWAKPTQDVDVKQFPQVSNIKELK